MLGPSLRMRKQLEYPPPLGMLHGEHSAMFSTFIKLPFVIKIIVLSILSGFLHRFHYKVKPM